MMMKKATSVVLRELRVRVANADFLIAAPSNVIDVVDRMLQHVSREWTDGEAPLRIDARFEGEVWHVGGSAPAGKKTLGRLSALPQVAGAIVSSMLAELSYHRNFNVWRAAVLERDGKALAFIGDDWESCITLTAHLHTRGWRILGGDYALVAGDTYVVSSFKKVLHANSSCVAAFPSWYRRAIEASPWYSSSQVIAFYAIDPTLVDGSAPWGEDAPLRAVLRVEGQFADHPSVERLDEHQFVGGIKKSDLAKAGVDLATLVVGEFIETCDLLEQWFATLSGHVVGV